MSERRPPNRAPVAAAAWSCFLAAFIAVAASVRAFAPYGSGLERMDVKLDGYARRKDDFSVVFLGSSRAVRGFVPSLFDSELEAKGVRVRSFNLGVAGARVTEMLFLLERVVELRPRGLRYVFIDPEDFEQVHDTRNVLAQSGIVWHDPATTWLVSRHLLASTKAREKPAGVLYEHWRACALNTLNVGRGARWVNAALGRRLDPQLVADVLGEAGDGHTALFDDQDALRARRRRFERGRAEYERMVANYAALPHPSGTPSPQFLSVLARIEALVRELGAEPVFVIQPALSRQWELVWAAQSGAVSVLLRYDEPERHPELFAHEQRFDSLHLNDAGAAIFTRRLAEDFAAWRAARGSEPR